MVLPIPEIPWPFPTPPFTPGQEAIAYNVIGIAMFFAGWRMFHDFAYPEGSLFGRKGARTFGEYTGIVYMFLLDYMAADPWGAMFWAGMFVFEAVRLRLGIPWMRIIQLAIATLRRIIREIRKRLP